MSANNRYSKKYHHSVFMALKPVIKARITSITLVLTPKKRIPIGTKIANTSQSFTYSFFILAAEYLTLFLNLGHALISGFFFDAMEAAYPEMNA
jgi:hypothetical protein